MAHVGANLIATAIPIQPGDDASTLRATAMKILIATAIPIQPGGAASTLRATAMKIQTADSAAYTLREIGAAHTCRAIGS